MSNAAMVVQPEYQGLTLVVSPLEALARYQELIAFVQKNMIPGQDYGLIPGVAKKVLFKPGAQKLAELYGLATDCVDVEVIQDWAKPFFFYRKKCIITTRRDARFIGSGTGSCNSMEDRYAYRWLFDNELPPGANKAQLKSKQITGKSGKAFTKYRVPNDDIYTLVNTIEKMADKRALVGAVVGVTQSSGIFTQDPEAAVTLVPEEAYGVPADKRSWEQGEDGPAAGVEDGPTDAQRAEYNRLAAGIAAAESVDKLRPWSKEADAALRGKLITVEQVDGVADLFNARKKRLTETARGAPEAAP